MFQHGELPNIFDGLSLLTVNISLGIGALKYTNNRCVCFAFKTVITHTIAKLNTERGYNFK